MKWTPEECSMTRQSSNLTSFRKFDNLNLIKPNEFLHKLPISHLGTLCFKEEKHFYALIYCAKLLLMLKTWKCLIKQSNHLFERIVLEETGNPA